MEPEVQEILGEHTDNPSEPRRGDLVIALGQEWQVSPLEQRIKGQHERWLCGNAVKAIADAEQDGFADEAQRMRKEYLSARSAGSYAWNGEVWRAALNDIPGSHQLFYLLLKRCHPDMNEFLAMQIMKDKPRDAAQAVKWAMGNEQAPESGAKKPALANGHVAVSN